MKKLIKPIAITLGVLIAILMIGRATGMLTYYSIPTPNMDPTLKVGDHILTSNLLSYERGNVVCFKYPFSETGDIYVKRLCAIGGDEIQMKRGVLYVNGENFDEKLDLKHLYVVSKDDYHQLLSKQELEEHDQAMGGLHGDSALVFIRDALARDLGYHHKMTGPGSDFDVTTFGAGNHNNFGPVTIPEDMLLMLGDNRDNSYDSRMWGYCPEENYRGKVIAIF